MTRSGEAAGDDWAVRRRRPTVGVWRPFVGCVVTCACRRASFPPKDVGSMAQRAMATARGFGSPKPMAPGSPASFENASAAGTRAKLGRGRRGGDGRVAHLGCTRWRARSIPKRRFPKEKRTCVRRVIPRRDQADLVLAFNGGFKAEHGHSAIASTATTIIPPRDVAWQLQDTRIECSHRALERPGPTASNMAFSGKRRNAVSCRQTSHRALRRKHAELGCGGGLKRDDSTFGDRSTDPARFSMSRSATRRTGRPWRTLMNHAGAQAPLRARRDRSFKISFSGRDGAGPSRRQPFSLGSSSEDDVRARSPR